MTRLLTVLWCVVAALLAVASGAAQAHEVRPAYLELKEVGADTYELLWKVPARGEDRRFGLHLRVPGHCRPASPAKQVFTGGAHVERSRIVCPGGLAGGEIRIEGLAATLTDALVRIAWADGASQVARLTPDAASMRVAAAPSGATVARTYLALGIEHILLGVDHLLFVLALLLVVKGGRRLVATVTAFTVAHSITLALASLGLVHVPAAPVEAVIALSIVFVAAEIVHARQGREGLAARAPWVVAFAFGLLHGFGFAGALAEIGLPQGHIPLALLLFNVGVELGQLLFIATALGAAAVIGHARVRLPHWAGLVPPYAIGSVAMLWVIQRIAVL